MRRFALLILLALAGTAAADPTAEMGVSQNEQPHAGLPFVLHVVARGFDESPQPEQPKLAIPGAHITPLGANPSVSRSIQIINGRRSESSTVTFDFQWRVEVDKPGPVHVGPITIVQGSQRATSNGADFQLDSVPTTDAMRIQLALPDRPVFVGETIEASLVWLFRQQPEDQSFSVPLMSMPEVSVAAPPVAPRTRTIPIAAGSKQLQLPYDLDAVDVAGVKYNRVTIHFFATPRQGGKVEVPGASVIAALAVGRADFFGRAPTQLYRATDAPHTFEVKPLPETDRPAFFAGAVGNQFAIAVATSRSVVQLGEPVELAITVKSNQRLDTLSLGKLDGPGGLPKDKFVVPADSPTGELSDDGKSKTFKVTVQVTGPATEIPALAFAYFDPVKGTYQTIHSDPIAVSVKGGSVVGAGDVIAAADPKKSAANAPHEAELALVGADLALSQQDDALGRPFGGTLMWILIALLYAVPVALFAARSWRLRTASDREDAAEARDARRRALDELARAEKTAARDAAGPLAAALRNLARVVDRELDHALLARIETEGYAPSSSGSPLSADVRLSAEKLVQRLATRPTSSAAKTSTAALVLFALARSAHGAPVIAQVSPEDALREGRSQYQEAMTLTEPTARKAAFARAASAFADASRGLPERPELLTDWGNAALGGGDVATATLAYRRALALDGANVRARRNLAWLRSRTSETFRPALGSATDTLFFFHQWTRARRLLVGGFAFAIVILLVIPWSGRRRKSLTALAVVPLVVWIAMLASVVLDDPRADDAVVMDAVVMRAADSAGAPAAMVQPLPRGAEVTVLENRDTWTRIRLASGTAGWVPAGAVERITR
ncbi:MAG: Tetratricopeptide 2 repeat protein [Myxococcales bacterium]|nr:Tetratricopeptide 2 repeat protein [Myxococcales bacterium]